MVDGSAASLEMHLVHYKATHKDISEAVAEGAQDSLAVLGIFFQVKEPQIKKITRIKMIKKGFRFRLCICRSIVWNNLYYGT